MARVPPPLITKNMLIPEGSKSAIPMVAVPFLLPVLLPFWAFRFVYRKFTGYEPPPPPGEFVADPEELAAALDAICAGSGREADEGLACPVCDRVIAVNAGLLLTHSR